MLRVYSGMPIGLPETPKLQRPEPEPASLGPEARQRSPPWAETSLTSFGVTGPGFTGMSRLEGLEDRGLAFGGFGFRGFDMFYRLYA